LAGMCLTKVGSHFHCLTASKDEDTSNELPETTLADSTSPLSLVVTSMTTWPPTRTPEGYTDVTRFLAHLWKSGPVVLMVIRDRSLDCGSCEQHFTEIIPSPDSTRQAMLVITKIRTVTSDSICCDVNHTSLLSYAPGGEQCYSSTGSRPWAAAPTRPE